MTSSWFSVRFGFSRFIVGVSSEIISCCSSLVNRFEITPEKLLGFFFKLVQKSLPEDKMLLRYSRNPSSLISKSVKMKVVPLPWTPQDRYNNFKSSRKFATLYERVSVIWNVLYPAMKEANFVSDCFPDPPTPTNMTFPRGCLITREILIDC